MLNKLKEYPPSINLIKYIDAYWFFRNDTGQMINFPVVPDGCSDIVFYLNNSHKLNGLKNTFITGVMEFASIVPIPKKMELFGIRYRPGILSYLLKIDMSRIKNKMCELSALNNSVAKKLAIDSKSSNKSIILSIEQLLIDLLSDDLLNDCYLKIIQKCCSNPEISVGELSLNTGISIKNLERALNKKVGLSPKKLLRIMRFQRAHKKISDEGLVNLITVAQSTGYFDQAHFNREYKKLVGFNPSDETMSILYNTGNRKVV